MLKSKQNTSGFGLLDLLGATGIVDRLGIVHRTLDGPSLFFRVPPTSRQGLRNAVAVVGFLDLCLVQTLSNSVIGNE